MAERPDLKFITLESLHPLKITLSSRDGPTIDLTPFVPPRHSKIWTAVPGMHSSKLRMKSSLRKSRIVAVSNPIW